MHGQSSQIIGGSDEDVAIAVWDPLVNHPRVCIIEDKEPARVEAHPALGGIDSLANARPRDRIFVIGSWADTVARSFLPRQRVLGVVNGRSWPATERLTARIGVDKQRAAYEAWASKPNAYPAAS